jgi:hypothetical protein
VDREKLSAMRHKAIVDVTVRGSYNYEAHLDLADGTEALCRFVERETEDEGLKAFAGKILEGITPRSKPFGSRIRKQGARSRAAYFPPQRNFPR